MLLPLDRHRRSMAIAVIVLAWIAVSGFYLLQEYRYTGQFAGVPLDDSWIHFRYAQNLARGYGLSFNPGELSAGSTSPLWVGILALASSLTGEFLITSKILGALSLLGTALIVQDVALDHTCSGLLALAAALVTLLSGRLAWTSLSGMETNTFTFAAMLAISQWEIRAQGSRKALVLGCLFGLTSLLRPEGWGLFALAVALQLGYLVRTSHRPGFRSRLQPLVVQILVYVLIASTYVIFCLLVTGSPLPNTFHVKVGLWEESTFYRYVTWIIALFALDNPLALSLSLIGVIIFSWNLRQEYRFPASTNLVLALAWLISLPLAYGLLAPYTTIYYFRYLVPLVPVAAIFCVVGAQSVQHLATRKLRSRAPWFPSLVLAALLLASLPGLKNWADLFGRSVSDIQRLHVRIGRWLAEQTEPDDQVATHDVGAIAYLSDRHIIDLAGLVSPSVLPALRGRAPGTWDKPVFVELQRLQPDYVVVLEGWFPTWSNEPKLVPIHSASVEDRAIAAGKKLIVYRCHW